MRKKERTTEKRKKERTARRKKEERKKEKKKENEHFLLMLTNYIKEHLQRNENIKKGRIKKEAKNIRKDERNTE